MSEKKKYFNMYVTGIVITVLLINIALTTVFVYFIYKFLSDDCLSIKYIKCISINSLAR